MEMPEILYGTAPAVRQAVRREGKRWARAYEKSGQFPQISVRRVAANEIVVIDAGSDSILDGPRWRAYLWQDLEDAIHVARKNEDWRAFGYEFEKYSLNTAYGTIRVVTSHSAPCSADRVATRLEAARRFYEELSSVRYREWNRPSCSFDDVLRYHYATLFRASDVRQTSDTPADLSNLIAWLRSADRGMLVDGVVRVALDIVRESPSVRNRQMLCSEPLIREKVSAISGEQFEMLSGVDGNAIYSMVLSWDRELGTD